MKRHLRPELRPENDPDNATPRQISSATGHDIPGGTDSENNGAEMNALKGELLGRREAIRRTALLMGGLLLTPHILGVMSGCKARPGVEWSPRFFNPQQARLLTRLADVIIPSGETPGASEAGVPSFIEQMITEIYTEDARERFVEGLDLFDRKVREEQGDSFIDLSSELQFEVASQCNRAAVTGGREPMDRFFLTMKELTMLGYFTSEPGATQVLRYEAVPGRYDGCVPFEEIGRTWAT